MAGFISLFGERICALLVAPEMQSKETGRALREHAKNLKGKLSLKVYKENENAFRFYRNAVLWQSEKKLMSVQDVYRS